MKGSSHIKTIFRSIIRNTKSALSLSTSPAHSQIHGRLFFWLPILLGVIAALLLYGYSEKVDALVIPGVVLLVGILIGWILDRSHIQVVNKLIQNQEKTHLNDASFYSRILPVWSKQVITSQKSGDRAIAELTILFGEIVTKLGTMLKMSKHSSHTGKDHEKNFIDAVAQSQKDVQIVFKDLKLALETVSDSKDMLLAEVTMYSANMKDMADEAKHVAFQSQIIALNAEIEAARAGEAGRAFAAVVSEMRQLAYKSGDTSKKMSKKAESIDAAMSRFYSEDKQMSVKEAEHVSRAETMLNDIVERFNKITLELEESVKTMENESRHIRDDISSALVALQFQDRVSQIMAHVADNINALSQLVGSGEKNLDADAWLSEMEENFSVDEEYTNLRASKATPESHSLLTFF
ncbi:MAG: methyl-accepting chemotaxis protein [Gammaproteobacteria bacterium]|nr:methyl-accepting chemotaxis protein [Gammaproteobacteria bacterium]